MLYMNAINQILVVEDNLTTAKTLTLFLQSAGYEVVCAACGDEAMALFAQRRFDLVLLDIMLPGRDGLSVCREIRKSSQVPVVMLTAKSSEDDIVYGLENGANDYVCKPFSSRELLARIRSCLRIWQAIHTEDNTPRDSEHVQVLGAITLNENQRIVTFDGDVIKLTKSEFAILAVMIKQPGRVFTREQLIQAALGDQYDGVDRTIDTHIWSLRKKLGEPKGNPRYLHSEMGIGYRLQDCSGDSGDREEPLHNREAPKP